MTKTNDILAANLDRLRQTEPQLAERLESTQPAPLVWVESRDGPLSASLEYRGRPLWLASRYDPLGEAKKLVASVDHTAHACIIALGLGLGYHVAHAARDMSDTQSLLIVYEPDIALLRAVLERVDHTAWLGRHNVIMADDLTDQAALLKRVENCSGMLTQGTILVTHPPTRQCHEQELKDFSAMVARVLEFCRTNMATALVNASRTYRNLTVNLPYYTGGATINELANAAKGYPAVCVSAGPSLAKNIRQLQDPEVRANVVLITAQTMLQPLLASGIRPDFVTALDYHEISRRFYEGLPELSDVTLVAQPLVHPTVLASFPGPIRMTHSGFLDTMLGEEARPIAKVPGGATVSHLSFYLAQHLGCDPIILVGQDLGFSNGLYYFPGTAIHDVWAPELGPFNTLEMMEWQRIMRHRNSLRKLTDIHGRPIYSDEQMLTYLKQFERDFAKAPQAVLDASEGGLPKEHTTQVTLADALAEHATRPLPPLPQPTTGLDGERLAATATVLKARIAEISELRLLSQSTIPLLRRMIEHQRDANRMDKLFDKLSRKKKRVDELSQAFELVNNLNAIGVFKRARSDRKIDNADMDQFERQRRQLERDIENIDWIAQACDEMLTIMRDALQGVERRRKSKDSAGRVRPAAGTIKTLQPSS